MVGGVADAAVALEGRHCRVEHGEPLSVPPCPQISIRHQGDDEWVAESRAESLHRVVLRAQLGQSAVELAPNDLRHCLEGERQRDVERITGPLCGGHVFLDASQKGIVPSAEPGDKRPAEERDRVGEFMVQIARLRLLPPAPPSAEVRAALVPLMSRPPVSMRASRLAPHCQSPPHVEPISSCASLKSTVSPHRCANPSGRSQHSRMHSKAQRPRAPRPLIGALQRVPFETVRDRMLAGVRASSRSNEPNPARIVARRAPYLRHAPNGSSADRVRPWGWLR